MDNTNIVVDTLKVALNAHTRSDTTSTRKATATSLVHHVASTSSTWQLTHAETQLAIDPARRSELGYTLTRFVGRASATHRLVLDTPAPAWLSRHGKDNATWFADAIAHIAELDPLVVENLERNYAYDMHDIQTQYEEWHKLRANEAAHKTVVDKVQVALDLKAALTGMLRIYGVSAADIDQQIDDALAAAKTEEAPAAEAKTTEKEAVAA